MVPGSGSYPSEDYTQGSNYQVSTAPQANAYSAYAHPPNVGHQIATGAGPARYPFSPSAYGDDQQSRQPAYGSTTQGGQPSYGSTAQNEPAQLVASQQQDLRRITSGNTKELDPGTFANFNQIITTDETQTFGNSRHLTFNNFSNPVEYVHMFAVVSKHVMNTNRCRGFQRAITK
jgi:hypothetical protein